MTEYLQDNELLTMGREGLLLPKFPEPRQYRQYGGNVFDAVTDWTKKLLSANQVAGGDNQYHPHQTPEQLVLPATAELPLLVVKSVERGMQIAKSYEPNNNHQQAGYLVPSRYVANETLTAIEVAPAVVSEEFTALFTGQNYVRTSPYYSRSSSFNIGAERYWSAESDSGRTKDNYSSARERILMPYVEGILAQFDYDASAFSGPDVITAAEYKRQVCERFDPAARHAYSA